MRTQIHLRLSSCSYVPPVAELYIVLYDSIVRNGADKVDHGVRGYYFGENGEHSWYDISKAIGTALVELGLSAEAEPTPFTEDELAKYFGSVVGAPVACFLASRC